MAQFSVKIIRLTGSGLGENQQSLDTDQDNEPEAFIKPLDLHMLQSQDFML